MLPGVRKPFSSSSSSGRNRLDFLGPAEREGRGGWKGREQLLLAEPSDGIPVSCGGENTRKGWGDSFPRIRVHREFLAPGRLENIGTGNIRGIHSLPRRFSLSISFSFSFQIWTNGRCLKRWRVKFNGWTKLCIDNLLYRNVINNRD